jgi:hypothetical protein
MSMSCHEQCWPVDRAWRRQQKTSGWGISYEMLGRCLYSQCLRK